MKYSISVLHINHMLRESATGDEQFVEQLCGAFNVEYACEKMEVARMAKEDKISLEEAGRQARYSAFEKRAKSIGANKIAVAHHQNDQAETVLFHLFRGCNVAGIRGMKPVRKEGVSIIRPLLCVSREEIENYLKEEGMSYVTDESNLEDIYTRNRIRNNILPLAEDISRGAVRHIADTAENMLEVEEFLQKSVDVAFADCTKSKKKVISIDYEKFMKKHRYLQLGIIYKALEELAESNRDLTQSHVSSIASLFEKQAGKEVHLPYGIKGIRDYDKIIILQETEENAIYEESKIVIPGFTALPNGMQMQTRLFLYSKNDKIPNKAYTKWFDYDKMDECPVVRTRKSGDYFYIDQEHTQKVKSYMINEKISSRERDQILQVAVDAHVLWMIGYRTSDYFKVSEQTKRIIEITIGGLEDGGDN